MNRKAQNFPPEPNPHHPNAVPNAPEVNVQAPNDPALNGDPNLHSSTVTEPDSAMAPPSPETPSQSPSSPPAARGWKRWPVIGLLLLPLVGFGGWKLYQMLMPGATPPAIKAYRRSARLTVRVVPARRTLAQGWVFDEGTALPVKLRVLNFYASGNITDVARPNGIPLKEGSWVTRGQRLATIDARRQTATIATAQADIQVANSRRKQAQATIVKAQANLKKAKSDLTLAKTEYQRYKRLFVAGAVAAIDLDVYRNRIDQAQSAFQIAAQEVRSAQEDLKTTDSSISAAQAKQRQVAVDLEDTQLVSPINGVVAYINIAKGEYWNTQYLNTSSPQKLIETAPIVVVDPSTYEVELEIQADDANAVRLGQRAFVVLEEAVSAAQASGANRQDLLKLAQTRGSQGSVFAISPSQTPGGRGTKVTIRNFRQVRNLKVGARVYVWIETVANPSAIVVPLGAVLARGQDFYVFVVKTADGTVERRRVTRGVEGLAGVEIISGVKADELVVVEGQNRLVDGTPVKIVDQAKRLKPQALLQPLMLTRENVQ
ncbi:multidrug transporter [filamentous cyanobacterium LEGE 11480]|uniref:Multidrug transporter n=1 Tax=Romeriopsis navalis LEGE 11480 TaxID=2777977 RepID=A0A928Z2X4_9CYAN|nr:multidrug transporter [Romeriopsis navalis]MBE9029492.1 multidrug transporter [Romeriopsis navalis LEGE 11480]